MRRLLIIIGIVIVLGVLIVRFGSGHVAGKAAGQYFAGQGIPVKTLRVSHASLRSALVSEAVLGRNDALALTHGSIDYGYRDQKVNLYRASADKLHIKLRTADGKWDIGGLEKLLGLPSLEGENGQAIFIDAEAQLQANLKGKQLTAEVHDALLNITQGSLLLNVKGLDITLAPAATEGRFDWKLEAQEVEVSDGAEKLTTPLVLAATGTLDDQKIEGQGMLSDKGKRIPLIVRFTHDIGKEKTSAQWTSDRIALTETDVGFAVLSPMLASIPPMNADMRMDGTAVIQAGKKPQIRQRIVVERAALSPLLQLLFKDDIAVTGDVTGEIPIRWAGEKAPQVIKAKLTNAAPGTLIYDPLSGPSAALQQEAQAGILMEALRKFEYRTLDITANSDAQGVLKATFHIIGANPDLFGGKTVDFTLNVNGNLLSILESQSKVNDVIEQSKPKPKK